VNGQDKFNRLALDDDGVVDHQVQAITAVKFRLLTQNG